MSIINIALHYTCNVISKICETRCAPEPVISHTTVEKLVMTEGDRLAMPLRTGSRGLVRSEATDVPTFEEASRRAIEAALDRCVGKIYGPDGAAALLGLKPGTLQSKMRKLGVSRSDFLRR